MQNWEAKSILILPDSHNTGSGSKTARDILGLNTAERPRTDYIYSSYVCNFFLSEGFFFAYFLILSLKIFKKLKYFHSFYGNVK